MRNDIDDWVKYLLRNYPELEAMQGIANGSKHVFSDQDQPTSTARGWVAEDWVTEGWVDLTPNVEFGGKSFRFVDILNVCVKYWDEFFQEYLP